MVLQPSLGSTSGVRGPRAGVLRMMLGPQHPQDPSSQGCLGTAGIFPERLEHLREEAVGRKSPNSLSLFFFSHI